MTNKRKLIKVNNKRKDTIADFSDKLVFHQAKSAEKAPKKIKLQNVNNNELMTKAENIKKRFAKSGSKTKDALSGTKSNQKRNFKAKGAGGGFDKNASVTPNWTDFKKKKKELRITRKQSKHDGSLTDVVTKAKHISEKLRRKKNSPTERENLVGQLHSVLKNGSYVRLALAHDTSRIIQWLLKYSSRKIRNDITNDLIPIVSQMVQSKYARNCVKKMLKYCSPEFHSKIIECFYGNVVNLASHSFSAPIIDVAYNEYANEKQRFFLQQEFYGDIYKNTKDNGIHKLSDAYKDSPEMKNAILSATKGNLERILNKNVHDNVLMHAVLYNYLTVCSADDRNEMLTSLSSHVAPLSNSKHGVKVAVMCVQHGTNKDKKTIMKVIKEHVVSLSTHEHGHLLLLAIFSSVDDTVLIKKALLSGLLEKVKDIAKEEWGRKTILWLVAPGDKKHFHPSFLNWLQEGVSTGTSKKDPEIRSTELREAALPILCKSLAEDPTFWMSNGKIGVLSVAILKAAHGEDLIGALNSLCKHICELNWSIKEGSEEVVGIEHPSIHACLKKLAQDDRRRAQNGDKTFGEELCDILSEDTLCNWLNFNRGCFLLVWIYENNDENIQTKLSNLLAKHKKVLKKKTFAGAKILLKKIT